MRYAELLLMLAEISNELGNGQEMTYLNVLDRAGVPVRVEFTQVKTHLEMLEEYKFELIGEGQDSFHVRRRGMQYFLIIQYCRIITLLEKRLLLVQKSMWLIVFSTNEAEIMKFLIPLSEINTNELIN